MVKEVIATNNTHNSLAFLLVKSLIDNPNYQLPYKSSEVEKNANHIAELIAQISKNFTDNRMEFTPDYLKGKL